MMSLLKFATKGFFNNRSIVKKWNELPDEITNAITTNEFKIKWTHSNKA